VMKTFVFLAAFLAVVLAHSYITSPLSRIPTYNCRIGGPPAYPVNCPGPCEAPKSQVGRNVQQTSRGAALTLDWPRNNHGGGFIRIAWAKLEDSDDHQAFTRGVQQVSCHETGFDGNPAVSNPRGCASDDPKNPLGGDSGSSEGGERACRLRTTIPTWLSDGAWTMQWAWYGGSYGYLGDYYSCVDFNVAGGAALAAQTNPVFKGGDVIYPNEDVCQFSAADRPHYCWREPCSEIWNNTFLFEATALNKGKGYLPQTVNPVTQAPVTQAPVPATTIPNDGDVPDIKVSVTVSLALAPRVVDMTVFTYEVSRTLGIPVRSIPEISIDFDASSEAQTIVHFILQNSQLADGSRVDPIAAAYKLKQMSQTQGSAIKSSALLSTMQVVSVDEGQQQESNFVGSQTFIIIVAVVGGIIVLGAIAAVVIVVLKKRRSGGFF